MLKFKQTTDYNCSVFATAFFLNLHGITPNIDEITRKLKPSKESGVSPDMVFNYLTDEFSYRLNVSVIKVNNLNHMPTLVNYFKEDDGHWGVVIWCTKRGSEICLFD